MLLFDSKTFVLEVDYEAHVGDMFRSGAYSAGVDHQLLEITRDPRWVGKARVEARLGYFDTEKKEADILAEIAGLKFRPAVPPELAVFGREFPTEQEKNSILAIGSYSSFGMRPGRWSLLAQLSRGSDGRSAMVSHMKVDTWGRGFRFLVIPTEAK